jgi:hypothetical protein
MFLIYNQKIAIIEELNKIWKSFKKILGNKEVGDLYTPILKATTSWWSF